MKLRTRLTIAFLTIVLLPTFLFAASFLGISHFQIKAVERDYGVDADIYGLLSNSVKMFSKMTQDVYVEVNKVTYVNPAKLENKEYLEEINTRLQEKSSFLLVRKENDVYYSGDTKFASIVWGQLPDFEKQDINSDGEMYIRDAQLLIKQIDFTFSDGDSGNVFIITHVYDMLPQFKNSMIQMIIAVILILVLTGIGLVSWIYSGMVSPLKQLNEATQKIAEGTLDFTMDLSGHAKEIDELCENFEEMRKRLKESTEEKLQNDNENRALISNITHDLKTPVTAIKGYAEGIMDGVADTPQKQEKYVRTIYSKANDLDRLINELTFYSGIDANRIPYNFAKIDISDYFTDCVDEVKMDMEAKNIQLTYLNQLTEPATVIADPVQMRKVINNIIGNSVKYLDKERGNINIRLKDAEEFIIVEIEDNGRGIAAKDLPYIFDRFYRADSSRNSSKGGSGIGLSIVKKVVEDHGGRIWATSKLGEGTTMIMELRKYKEVELNE